MATTVDGEARGYVLGIGSADKNAEPDCSSQMNGERALLNLKIRFSFVKFDLPFAQPSPMSGGRSCTPCALGDLRPISTGRRVDAC